MKLNAYEIVRRAVEEGIAHGWAEAHKHTDTPTPESVKDFMEDWVMACLTDVIHWDDERDLVAPRSGGEGGNG